MFQTEWPVLLVDDDPDVLAVSKLAMKSFEIDGVPIKLFTATSKDEAVKLLSGSWKLSVRRARHDEPGIHRFRLRRGDLRRNNGAFRAR